MKINFIMEKSFITILFISFSISVFSQSIDSNITDQSEIGITGGYQFFKIFKNNDIDTTKHYYDNYSVSIFYLHDLTKIFSSGIEIENTAIKMNSEYSETSYWGSAFLGHYEAYYYENLDYNLNNLNFFVLLHFNLISKNKIRLSLNIDPYFSYTIYSKVKGMIEQTEFITVYDTAYGHEVVNPELRTHDINESPNIEKINLGFKLGYNLEFNISQNISLLFIHNYYFIKNNTLNNKPRNLQSMKLSLGLCYRFTNKNLKKL